jgi:drug/metabolite transporter (DMT)-like permease
MVLVGSSVAVGRSMTAALPLSFASLARFVLASLVLVPLVILVEGRFPRVSRRTFYALLAQAACGSFAFTACLLSGLRLTGAASAGVMAAATPAAVALLGLVFFKERPGRLGLAGIGCVTAGVAALGFEGGEAAGPSPLAGNLLVLCAVCFEAVFLLLRRTVREPLSPLAAAMWVSLLGGAFFLVPGIVEAMELDYARISLKAAGEVAYYGLGVTAAAYMFWFYGVVRVDAATAGVATGIMPVAALACAAWWCGESVGWRELSGCAGVLAGILCLARAGAKKPARPGNVSPAAPVTGILLKSAQEPPALGGGGT